MTVKMTFFLALSILLHQKGDSFILEYAALSEAFLIEENSIWPDLDEAERSTYDYTDLIIGRISHYQLPASYFPPLAQCQVL